MHILILLTNTWGREILFEKIIIAKIKYYCYLVILDASFCKTDDSFSKIFFENLMSIF
jgi:hypothetical protein